ncbi:hypothetical protein Tco_1408992 [Tanacetum coccineum]
MHQDLRSLSDYSTKSKQHLTECRRAWSIIAWMDSGVMLFGLVLLPGVFCPRLVAGAMIRLQHKRQNVRESLPSVPDAYGQSLEALLSQPTASESESHVPDVVSE